MKGMNGPERSPARIPDARRRRAERICIAGIALSAVYSLALIPVAPRLLGTDPVLLEALRGSTPAMVAAGAFARVGEASLVLAALAPLLTLVIFDPFLWWAGRLWGPRAAEMLAGNSPRARRWIVRAGRHNDRLGGAAVVLAYYLPIPSAIIYAAAGWTGMGLRRFLVLDTIGAGLWIALNVGLGYAIGQGAVDVAKSISRYALYVSIAVFVLVFLIAMRRAQRDETRPPSEPASALED
jgi:membrane-associated protein